MVRQEAGDRRLWQRDPQPTATSAAFLTHGDRTIGASAATNDRHTLSANEYSDAINFWPLSEGPSDPATGRESTWARVLYIDRRKLGASGPGPEGRRRGAAPEGMSETEAALVQKLLDFRPGSPDSPQPGAFRPQAAPHGQSCEWKLRLGTGWLWDT